MRRFSLLFVLLAFPLAAQVVTKALTAGVQGRVAFTNTILGEASVSTLPRVTIGDYSGRALR